jgi:hypothetical protein
MLGLGEKVWVVNFRLGKTNDDCGLRAAGKQILKEEGDCSLIPSSTCVADCVRDEVVLRYCFIIITCGAQVGTVELEHAGAVCLFGCWCPTALSGINK